MKKILYLFLVVSQLCTAQAYQYQWAKKAGSKAGDNVGLGICTDNSNNVYVTGYMDSTYQYCNSSTTNPSDYSYCFVSKYNSSGQVKWTQKVLGININEGQHITTDSLSNVYVVGQFIDTSHWVSCVPAIAHPPTGLIFNTTVKIHDTIFVNDSVLISGNNYYHYYDTIVVDTAFYINRDTIHGNNLKEVFIASYDSSGNFRWVNKAVGLNSNLTVNGVTADSYGNLYIIGQFYGTAKFDKDTIYSNGNGDFYLAKYSADSGKVLWVQHGGSGGMGVAYSRASNNICVTGTYMNTATFGTTTLNSMGNLNNNDIFIAAIDTGGTWQWAKSAGGAWDDEVKGLALDNAGNIFITGHLTLASTAIFGTDTLTVLPSDLFLAKYSASGNYQWAIMAGGSNVDDVNSIATDVIGNVYLTGDFQNTATFGSHNLNALGGYDIFISKYSSAGAVLGSQSAGGASNDVAYGMAIDGTNGLYITGSFKDTCHFGNLNANRLIAGQATGIFVAKTGINVGINETSAMENKGLNIYPNPTSGAVTINYSTSENTNLTIRLTNLEGQIIYSEQKSQAVGVYKHTLDFSQQAKGIYFVEVISNKETLVRKLVIQ